MSTKMTGVDQFVSALSGGNKQKVVLARWVGKDSDLIILDSPTRGIDVKVKADIYAMMNDMRKKWKIHYHDLRGDYGAAWNGRPYSDHERR